jgi:hypothetical protein
MTIFFENGSQLERIEEHAFYSSGLKSFVFPNSVQVIDGSAFEECSLESVAVESGSANLRVLECFLEDSSGSCLIRSFAQREFVLLHSSVEVICKSSFSYCASLRHLAFESRSHLLRIEESAFSFSGIVAIAIPASVEVLCKSCFAYCMSLTDIAFEPGSRLQGMEELAFALSSLTTVTVPASCEIIGKSCFSYCRELVEIRFEPMSNLAVIEAGAFAFSGLRRFEVPASVRCLDPTSFSECRTLQSVTFEPGSRLLGENDPTQMLGALPAVILTPSRGILCG